MGLANLLMTLSVVAARPLGIDDQTVHNHLDRRSAGKNLTDFDSFRDQNFRSERYAVLFKLFSLLLDNSHAHVCIYYDH